MTMTINLLQAYELLALQEKMTKDAIVADVDGQNMARWADIVADWPMEELQKLAQQPEDFKQALQGDYTISYLTLPGLSNLLQKRFKLTINKHFFVTDTAITQLKVNATQEQKIRTMVASNWQVTSFEEGLSIHM